MANREIRLLHFFFVNNWIIPINRLPANIGQTANVRRESQIQIPSTQYPPIKQRKDKITKNI